MITNKQFEKIQDIKWYPWVGDNYEKLPLEKRVFILGESSRYGIGDERNTLEKYDDKDYIKWHIEDARSGAYKEYGSKLLTNMHKTLLGSDEVNTDIFWNNVVSTNFIQRALNYTNKERPNGNDYAEAWRVLFDLFELLNPKKCIFFGSSAKNSLKNNIKANFSMEEISKDIKIGRCYGYSTRVFNNQSSIDLIFIKHPSSYYSWKPWREYLIGKIPTISDLV